MSVRILPSCRVAVVVILSSLVVLAAARVSMAQRQQAAVEAGVNDQLITKFHGTEFLLANGEFAAAGKYFVNAAITDAAADRNGDVTVDFRVEDSDGVPATAARTGSFSTTPGPRPTSRPTTAATHYGPTSPPLRPTRWWHGSTATRCSRPAPSPILKTAASPSAVETWANSIPSASIQVR